MGSPPNTKGKVEIIIPEILIRIWGRCPKDRGGDATTPEFLQHFGLSSILEMPPLAKLEEEGDNHDEMLKG